MVRVEPGAASSVERYFQFAVLGLVASSFLAVASSGYLDAATIAGACAGFLLRAVLLGGLVKLRLSRRATAMWMAACGGFFLADYFVLSPQAVTAIVHLVVALAVFQVITAAGARDSLVSAAISFAGLASAAVLSLSFGFLAALALYLGFAVAVLTSGEICRSLRKATAVVRGGPRGLATRLAVLAAGMAVGILAITAGLFFLSPHGGGSAIGSLLFQRMALPGFSRRMALDEIGRIKTSSRTAMHIRLYTSEPIGSLKWRGGALTFFDGRNWSNPGTPETRLYLEEGRLDLVPPAYRRPGRHIVYDVYPDAIDSDALFFAGTPEHVDMRINYLLGSAGSGYRLDERPPSGFRYEAYSLLEDPPETSPVVYPPPALDSAERSHCLQLPALDPRIGQLAGAMTAGARSDLEKARAVERRLRTEYGYTLNLPRSKPVDPLADFLFARKKGHCEYFASAMAILLRAEGIPTRLATGFQSGIYNDLTNLWVIRAGDAHAWVEAWIAGRGWTTFDPTPPDPRQASYTLTARLALYRDAAEGLWREWVVRYDPNHQGSLMYRVQQGAARLGIGWFDTLSDAGTYWDRPAGKWVRRSGPRVLAALGMGTLLWFAIPPAVRAWGLRRRVRRVRRGQAGMGDAALLYRRMLQIVKRRGYQKPVWFTPLEFAASLPPTEWGGTVCEFTAAYNAWRFGGRRETAPQLSMLLEKLAKCR